MTHKDDKPSQTARAAAKAADAGKGAAPAQRAKKQETGGEPQLVVVGIGASAGGLEALSALISHLPVDLNAAYIVAQHLDLTHRSMLSTLLARHTEMPVMEIEDQMVPAASHVYVSPPDRDVSLVDGRLRLKKIMGKTGPKPSVDYLLCSLAEDKGADTVGIILSGTGSDGAHGLRAIKAAGGITIAQDEASAKYFGMPSASIATGHVDLVSTPENMASELPALLRFRPMAAGHDSAQETVPEDMTSRAIELIREQVGTDFNDYKRNTIIRRINRRMVVHRLTDINDYIRYLEHSPKEIAVLYKDILISVTSFFRDEEAFDALRQALKDLVRGKRPGDEIRVWVPGCASGEEAYSIAILVAETLGADLDQYSVQIFGTDLDQDAIVSARKAVYPISTAVDMEPRLLERYFVRIDGKIKAVKRLRDLVVFAHQNLIRDPPFSHLDVISCRNMLIYFKPEIQKRVLDLFHYALEPGGVLFLGKSEALGHATDLFTHVDKTFKIFKRIGGARPPICDISAYRPNRMARKPRPPPTAAETSISNRHIQVLAETFAPPSVILDNHSRIMHVFGEVNPYLQLNPGDANLDIISMARKELRLELRAVVSKCRRQWETQSSARIRILNETGNRSVQIQARPLADSAEAERLIVVSFLELPAPKGVEPTIGAGEDEDPRFYELEYELSNTRERLQATVEELETANEELQSLNEELQSSNEELQSSNEELETTNEELQSTNEELTTVNEELQVKSTELADALADLENIQNDIGLPLVVVDKALRVTRFTPDARVMFDLHEGCKGSVITTIHSHVDMPDLRKVLFDVIDQGEEHASEIQAGSDTYLLRVFPYCSEEAGMPQGAVLTFFDLTKIQQLERHIERLKLDKISKE